ncbi:hypothetical protein CRM22_005205 [Opisthorchis felineus]|uniref:Uncharacterized protein n=1 Tax=Opisthorchis felineus TaxID=147828 RepID=A0A4V3SF12_OPIFE|nr:hypothetical protein CRM22_005205 [Opisthorchis felineus]
MEKAVHVHVPLPVQSFLLTQTFSFLQTPSAREGVCTTFEKVIVQNILHGRSILLCEAIQSITRWQFVKAAFPHVVHCAAAMLREKLRHQLPTSKHMRSTVILSEAGGRSQLQFSQYETKLLYTLHWILLDAAAECEDAELEGTSNRANRTTKYGFLHDLSSIQLFIYLFAPIIEQLQASDFETLKLEAGLAIWVPLMAFHQPARGTLPTPVKLFDLDHGMFGRVLPALDRPRQVEEDIEEVVEVKTTEKIVGGIYVGEGKKPKHVGSSLKEQAKAIDIGAILLHFDRTVPDVDEVEPVSTESVKQKKPVIPPIILTQIYPTGKPAPPKALAECIDDDDDSGTHEPGQSTPSQTSSHQSDHLPPGYPRIQWMLSHETENVLPDLSMPDSEENTYHSYGSTCLLATHCDVAVIRCLFCAEWCEAGVYWSLTYLFKRLLQIRSARQRMEQETRKIMRLIRDNATWRQYGDLYGGMRLTSEVLLLGMRSLSMPDLSVLCTFPTHSSPSKHRDSGQDRRSRDHVDSNQHEMKITAKDILLDSESGAVDRQTFQSKHLKTRPFGESSESGHDKKVGNRPERTNIPGDLKNIPDEFGLKVPATLVSDASLSLALPLVGSGGSRLPLGLSSGHQASWKNSKRSRIADIKERFTRASKFKGTDQLLKSGDASDADTNGLRDVAPETQKRLEVPHVGPGSSSTLLTIRSQHSFDALQSETESVAGKRASVYKTGTRDSPESPEKKVTWTEEEDLKASSISLISHSFTDSDIIYHTTEKVDEVPGAVHYISVNGQLDYSVVLRALYWVSTEHKSTRVCVQLLRCLCTLFEMDIVDHASKQKPPQFKARKPVSLHSKWKKFKISPRVSTIHKLPGSPQPPLSKDVPSLRRTKCSFHGDRLTTGPKSEGEISPTSKQEVQMKVRRRNSAIMYVESDDSEDDGESGHNFASKKSGDASEKGGISVEPCYVHGAKSSSHSNAAMSKSHATELGGEKGYRFRKNIGSPSTSSPSKSHHHKWMHRRSYTVHRRQFTIDPPEPFASPTTNKETRKMNHAMATEIVLRIVRTLGCSYGHHGSPTVGAREATTNVDQAKGHVLGETEETRRLAHDCLIHLYESNRPLFVRVLSRMISTMCISDIMEMLHALTGYCLDPAVRHVDHSKSLSKISTYANSFGQLTLGMGSRGAESIVISCILGPFLRRLVRCRSELVSQENLSLFGDIRQLFTYLREVHGSTFRRNMLVAMMCPIKRACERPRPKMPSTWSRMSTRNSMWLLPRQDKQRSNSIFSEAVVDESNNVARGHRLTSWHNLLPRASLVGRGIRINSGSSSAAMMDRASDTSHSRGDGESAAAQPLVEHRWVNAPALKEGLLEFSFLMECCEPGTILEPELVAALLDLDAPVVARACLLLECAAFVHRCNRGEWAGWMKFNLPSSFHHSAASSHPTSIRPSPGTGVGSGASAGSGMNGDSSVSDIAALKRNAGRLFHAWGEALGRRLGNFIQQLNTNGQPAKSTSGNASGTATPDRRKETVPGQQFSALETEENFLDDASVNPTGDSCPYALLSAGVQLLLEITAYLREMHPRLPQPVTDEQASQPMRQPVGDQPSDSGLVAKRQHSYDPNAEKAGSISKHLNSSPSRAGTSFRAARRRLSILMPIFGSGGSMNADEPEVDAEQPVLPEPNLKSRRNLGSRRISFAMFTETKDRKSSLAGSSTSLDRSPESDKQQNKSLLRHHRGSGSFKRPNPYAQDPLGVNFRRGSRTSHRKFSDSGESSARLSPDVLEHSPSQLSDETSDQEPSTQMTSTSARASATQLTSKSRTKLDEQSKFHGVVRRSVSAALALRRQRASSILTSTTLATEQDGVEHDSYSTYMPWIDSVIQFLNHTNFSCDHQSYCLPNCFERQQHQCRALMNGVKQVYGAEIEHSFVRSVSRQINTNPAENVGRYNLEESIGPGRTSQEQTEGSSDTDDSSHFESTGDLSSSDLAVKHRTRSTKVGSKTEFPTVLSHDSLNGLTKTSDSDVETGSCLSHRLGSVAQPDSAKPKISIFSKVSKRKESQFPGLASRRESTTILEKLRLRSSNRLAVHTVQDLENPGLSSLLGLGVLAGAGAGLLRASSSSAGLFGLAEPEECETIQMHRHQTRRVYRQPNMTELPIQRYILSQVKNMYSNSFNLLNKSALLLTHEQLEKVVPLAWELLLETEEELVSSTACFILFCGVRSASLVQELLLAEMQHNSAHQRLSAILRFRALWTHRHHVWSRLDEGASAQLRLPPLFIEFVLPSPTLGYIGQDAPDPMWQIRKGTSAEEVQLKQNEATKTFVTASTSRRKQQQELLARALTAETLRRRDARRQFHLTTCPVLERAAIEPAFTKEHRDETLVDEGNVAGGTPGTGTSGGQNPIQEEFAAAVKRLSVAPLNRTMLVQSRSSSWRQGSIPWFRSSGLTHDAFPLGILRQDDRTSGMIPPLFPPQPLQQAQYIFPSALCAATVPLIHLLDDSSVNDDGIAVSTIAEHCIFQCLVEDTNLFLRFIFERLTRTAHKGELIFALRKMIQRLPELPKQSAHVIFNNLVGYIMFHVRTPNFNAPEAIASALSVLHLVVPHVQNIYFKDLKQTLRREQIDSTLLLTANLPCAKQFNVFDNDIGVAQLVRLHDENKDYQFEDILKDALESSGIPLNQINSYFLCDDRSGIICNNSHYIRDFYPFKRNHNPKLRIKQMEKNDGLHLLQQNALNLKFQEIGKVLFTTAVLQCTPSTQISNHVFFLHEELTKLPSFPRKALESEFGLYGLQELGEPLLGLDTVHKISWCELLSSLFERMPNTYPWSADLQLFLNVYNGTLILLAEDSSVLRQCLAFYIQCSHQFKMAFSTSGYAGILPTLLRVYNQQTHNAVLTQAVEFTCRQFYVMHRIPFILQLFGSLANYVAVGDERTGMDGDFYRIQPATLYRLLRLINRPLPDNLRILELCNVQKPLKALDFCYEDDEGNWSVLEAVNLCVAVIVYAPDSYRARQMLIILQAILPFILRDFFAICTEENCGVEPKKAEINAIQKLCIAIRQLIATTEFMARRTEDVRNLNMHAPGGPVERRPEQLMSNLGHSWSRKTVRTGRIMEIKSSIESSLEVTKPISPTIRLVGSGTEDLTDVDTIQSPIVSRSFYEPKEVILQLACDFLSFTTARLNELGERQRVPELLDSRSHVRLSEIVQSIIKQIPSNPELLSSPGIQRYFLEVLPSVDWSHESMRSCKALEALLGRLNRTLPKLLEHASHKPRFCWDDIVRLIRSMYLIIKKNRSIAHLKEIRVLIDTLKRSVIFDPAGCLPALVKTRIDPYLPLSGWSSNTNVPGRQSLGDSLFGGISPESSSVGLSYTGRASRRGRLLNTTSEYGSHLTPSGASSVPPRKHPEAGAQRSLDNAFSFKFAAEVIRLIALVLQTLGPNFSLKDMCERCGPDYNARCPAILEGGFHTLAVYLGQLIIPLLFRCSAGRKDSPTLSKENVFYAMDVCITALFAPVTSQNNNCRNERAPSAASGGYSSPSFIDTKEKSGRHVTEITSSGGRNPSPVGMELPGGSTLVKLINFSSLGYEQEDGTNSNLTRLLSPTLTFLSQKDTLSMPMVTLHPNSINTKHTTVKSESLSTKSRSSVASLVPQKARHQALHAKHAETAASSSPLTSDKPKNFKGEFAHRLGFLGLKLLLVAYSRHASVRLRLLTAALTKLALNGQNGIQLWKFFDFLVTHRPPIFVHLLPFIRFKMANLCCATPGEQAYQQIVSQKLMGLHLPVPQTTAVVLRELLSEMNTIQHDVQHFTQAHGKEGGVSHLSNILEPAQRFQSADQSVAFRKQPSKKMKPQLGGLTEENLNPNGTFSALERYAHNRRIDILASVTSESVCSNDMQDDIGIGLPTLSRSTRGNRTMVQTFRQSFLTRDTRKRIGAQEGSRLLTQNPTIKQTDPILTASAESILRGSQPVAHRKSVRNLPSSTCDTRGEKLVTGQTKLGMSDSPGWLLDTESIESFSSDELRTSVGPAAAAAIATSLYGSGAPYLQARDKARQELIKLVGINPPTLDVDKSESSLINLMFSEQQQSKPTELTELSKLTVQVNPAALCQPEEPAAAVKFISGSIKPSAHPDSKIDYV